MSEVIDFEKCKVADLKRMLKERGLSNTGVKSELVTRLQAYEGAASENGAEDVVADEDELLQDGEDEEPEDDDDDDDDDEGAGEKGEEAEVEAEVEAELEADEGEEAPAAKDDDTPAPKTIKLNKITPITSTTDAKPAATEVPEETTGEPEEASGTPAETPGMLAKRAERFGIQSADAKKLARAQRFGIPITAPAAAANGKTSVKTGVKTAAAAPTPEEMEKLKKRAERFGTVVSEPLAKVAEKEKILKRKERFGALTSTASSAESPATTQEMDEKKRRRLERFGNAAK